MKRTLLALVAMVATLACARANLIAQWNFNDTNAPVTAPLPAVGTGAALLIGGTGAALVAGASVDNTNTPNKAWSIKTFPASTSGNKTAGVQFNVSTVGYHDLSLSWYQENSTTASRYVRLQYTLDGSTFTDADVIAMYKDGSYTNKTVNLSAILGATNNPLFGFRLVTEFESTAGSGVASYLATKDGSSYSPAGAIHYDLVTVSGTPFPPTNYPPTISALSNQTVRVSQSTPALPFAVLDDQTPAASLTLNKASSNPGVVPAANIVFSGTASSRTVTVTAGSQAGSSLVTVYVMDTGGASNSTSFTVTVLPANTAPVISAISRTNTLLNTAAPPIGFTVGDLETPAASLTLSATSANTALVPNANIVFGGSGSNRMVTVTPAGGQTGVAPITVTVSDGTNAANSIFDVMVTPSPGVLFYDPFNYGNGSLLTNSGFLWDHRSGTIGDCQVTNGALQVTAAQTEDLSGTLVGAPYVKGSNTVLYAAFKLTALTLPKPTPDYFAHFGSGTTYRSRIYVGAPTNATPGSLRLYVSNATDTNTVPAGDLKTNTASTLVLRYNIDAGSATLWLNPASESDPGATAADLTNAVSISSFNFRQDSGCGAALLVDDLKVGLSFAAVTGTNVALNPIPLVVERKANNLILTWTNAVFGLQAAPVAPGTYANVPGATSPYTNAIGVSPRFFRLRAN